MERAEDEMACLRGGDGERDGLEIAHFTDHDDIGIFAERAAQGGAEGLGVGVHFALGDVAILRLEDVFDRVLEGDDVLVPLEVYLLDERGEGGRFAAADRAGDEDEAVVITGEQLEALRQTQLIHRAHVGADDAENEIDPEPLPNDAGAKAPEVGGIGEIDVAALVQLRHLRLGQETGGERGGIFRGQFRRVRPDRLEISVQAPERRGIDSEVNVGSADFLAEGQILIDMRDGAEARKKDQRTCESGRPTE